MFDYSKITKNDLVNEVENSLKESNAIISEIKDSETLVELKQAAMKEEVHGDFDLITLEPHFYIKIKSYMERLPEKDYVKVESLLKKSLRTSKTKIIRLADSSKLTAEISQKLSVEEHEFYNQIHELSTKFSKKIVGDKKWLRKNH